MKHKHIQVLLIFCTTIAVTWLLQPLGLWFDEQVMSTLTNVHQFPEQSMLYRTAEVMTVFGGSNAFMVAAIGTIAFLFWKRQNQTLLMMMVFLFGGVFVNTVIKLIVSRPRPYGIVKEMDIIGEELNVISYSFPSAHAFRVVLILICLIYLVARFSPFSVNFRRTLFAIFTVLAFVTVASRVFLGVHYPTDVFAGAAFAGLWFVVVVLLFPINLYTAGLRSRGK